MFSKKWRWIDGAEHHRDRHSQLVTRHLSPLPINPGQPGGGAGGDSPFSADNTPFDAIGGTERVRELARRFYAHMGGDASVASTRDLYPDDDLTESEEKLYEFLVGWLGGPQLYIEKHGHPRLRQRHAPFRIDEVARDHWLACMTHAMDEMKIEGAVRAFLDARFAHVADFLRNAE